MRPYRLYVSLRLLQARPASRSRHDRGGPMSDPVEFLTVSNTLPLSGGESMQLTNYREGGSGGGLSDYAVLAACLFGFIGLFVVAVIVIGVLA